MKRSTLKSNQFASLVTLIVIVAALVVVANQPARAGDQEGVSGYKFKIYDPDGDGIDGNEGNETSGGGALSGAETAFVQGKIDRQFSIRLLAEQARVWLLFWII